MEPTITKIFRKAAYECDPALAEAICLELSKRSRRRVQFKVWTFSLIGIASLFGLAPAFKTLTHDLTQSGFYEYFSLIFSSTGSVVSYWKELFFSLVEALPTVSILLTLSLIFICFLSLRNLLKQIHSGPSARSRILSA